MLRPAMSQILQKDESAYEFVIEVARRAREIVNEAEEDGMILDEKPVQLAVEEFANGYPRQPVHYIGEEDAEGADK